MSIAAMASFVPDWMSMSLTRAASPHPPSGLNGRRVADALRDTVDVPPMSMVTVALDAGEAARWMLHCHNMLHLASGMTTEFAVTASV